MRRFVLLQTGLTAIHYHTKKAGQVTDPRLLSSLPQLISQQASMLITLSIHRDSLAR